MALNALLKNVLGWGNILKPFGMFGIEVKVPSLDL
jgi:hypothetical protein